MKIFIKTLVNRFNQIIDINIIKKAIISFSIFLLLVFAVYFELNLLFRAIENTSAKDSIYNKLLELEFNIRGIVEISSFSLLSYFVLSSITRELIVKFLNVLNKNKNKYINLSNKIYAAFFISITIFTAFSNEQFTLIATIISFIAIFLSIEKYNS